nr:6-phosphogluconolactonase 2 [Tanacetum cinerariifolium]
MVPHKIKIFETEDVIPFALVDYISELSTKSIAGHGSFSVALPAGRMGLLGLVRLVTTFGASFLDFLASLLVFQTLLVFLDPSLAEVKTLFMCIEDLEGGSIARWKGVGGGLWPRLYMGDKEVKLLALWPRKGVKVLVRLSSYIVISPLPVSCSLQALSNLNYLFRGFMDYFWSYNFFDAQSCESFHTICCSGGDEMSGFGDNFFDAQSCESFHTICCSGGDEMSGFGKAVDNDPNCVMSV